MAAEMYLVKLPFDVWMPQRKKGNVTANNMSDDACMTLVKTILQKVLF